MAGEKEQEGGLFDQKSLKIHNHQMYEWTLIQSFKKKIFFSFLALPCLACGILVPWPGIEPVAPAVEALEAWSLNHRRKEVPRSYFK